MEDRYLFRAKIGNGYWTIGFLRCKDNKWYINNAGSPFAYEVRPDTICQCTGYRGIYEKDIFQCDDEREEYCKAVDDFAESVKNLIVDLSVIRFKDIDEIAEQLKVGDGR